MVSLRSRPGQLFSMPAPPPRKSDIKKAMPSTRTRPGQLFSMPAPPPRKSGIKRKAPVPKPAARKRTSTRGAAAPRAPSPRTVAANRVAAQLALLFKKGRGGRKAEVAGKKRKIRKFTYTKSASGKHTTRSKIYQGQFFKVGLKNGGMPATSGAVQGRKVPSGFLRFGSKRNALIKLLAERAGLVDPAVQNYKSYMRAARAVEMNRPANLGLKWR